MNEKEFIKKEKQNKIRLAKKGNKSKSFVKKQQIINKKVTIFTEDNGDTLPSGVVITEIQSDLLARVSQHEIDHLNGITMLQRPKGLIDDEFMS